jgi:hypothetical protein
LSTLRCGGTGEDVTAFEIHWDTLCLGRRRACAALRHAGTLKIDHQAESAE